MVGFERFVANGDRVFRTAPESCIPAIGIQEPFPSAHGGFGAGEDVISDDARTQRDLQPWAGGGVVHRPRYVLIVVLTIQQRCQADLLQVAYAIRSVVSLLCKGRKEDCNDNGEDKEHDQKLDQGESAPAIW